MQGNGEIYQEQEKLLSECDAFWHFCKLRHNSQSLDQKLFSLERESIEFHSTLGSFTGLLEEMPVCVIIQKWLKEQASQLSYGTSAIDAFKTLYEKEILPTTNVSGDLFTIKDLRIIGHHELIERIRCLINKSPFEREKLVSIYIDFANYLSRLTFGLIPLPSDPDKNTTKYRLLPLEDFREFSTHLSERDSLIASLMYFTGRPLNEILNLKVQNIDTKREKITFSHAEISIPRYVLMKLQAYLMNKAPADALFTNRSGKGVNRSHIFIAFQKASAQMSHPRKITPKNLSHSSQI